MIKCGKSCLYKSRKHNSNLIDMYFSKVFVFPNWTNNLTFLILFTIITRIYWRPCCYKYGFLSA